MRSEDGYTLLELLVAVAIVAMLAAPMAMSIELGIASWRNTHDAVSVQERDFLVRDRLRVWLSGAYPHDVNRRSDVRRNPMSGTQETLTFVSAVHPDPQYDVLYSVSLSIEGGNLVAEFAPDHTAYQIDRAFNKAILLGNITALELAYLDHETDPSNPIWIDDWQDRYYLPAAIRVKLSFAEDDRVWPDLIVETVIEEWSHCAFDEVSRKCRTGADAG